MDSIIRVKTKCEPTGWYRSADLDGSSSFEQSSAMLPDAALLPTIKRKSRPRICNNLPNSN